MPQQNPNFNGGGRFGVDNRVAPANTAGPLAAGRYVSESPITTQTPVSLSLPIVLDFFGAAVTRVPVNGVQVRFTTGTDVQSGAPGLIEGRIAGSIKSADVQNTIVPQMAASLNRQVQLDPNSNASKQILSIFDTGGCGNAREGDGKIEACEVATNQIVMAILAPDVDIYDANGKYAPSAQNAGKDSLSVAVGFTAVRAAF